MKIEKKYLKTREAALKNNIKDDRDKVMEELQKSKVVFLHQL